jgi:excisionase family DNA binding protein
MVADRLSCSREHVYREIDRGGEVGGLPAIRLGQKKGFRVRESDLVVYIERCAQKE